MSIDWKHIGFTGAAEYELQIKTSKAIGLDDGAGHQDQIIKSWKETVHKVGQWTIKAQYFGLAGMLLKIFCNKPLENCLELNFEEGVIPQVHISLQGENRDYSDVNSVLLYPKEAQIRINRNTKDPGNSDSHSDVSPSNATIPSAPTEDTHDKRKESVSQEGEKQLRVCEARLKEAEKARDIAIQNMAELQISNSALEAAVKASTANLLSTLQEKRGSLSIELENQLDALKEAEQVNAEVQLRITEAKERKGRIEKEKEALDDELIYFRTSYEVINMNFEEVKKELDDLRLQYGEDRNIEELFAEDPILLNNYLHHPLSQLLDEIRSKLVEAEELIEKIAEKRKTMEDRIIDAVVKGDNGGRISLSEEQGGRDDGVRSGTEKQNP